MKKPSQVAIINIPLFGTIERVIMQLLGFGLMLVPSFLTRYLMDERIEQGKEIPLYWFGVIICVALVIHLFRYYFVSYRSQVFSNKMASDFCGVIGGKIASSRMPEYEAESKSKILNIMNMDVASIYTLVSYVVNVPVSIVKIMIIMVLLFDAHYGFALMAVVLAPLYVLSSYVNKGRLEELVRGERKAADIWVQEFQVMISSKVSIGLNNAFPYIMNRFERGKEAFYKARNRQHFCLLITKELPRMINTLAMLIVLVIGGNMVVEKRLTLGTLMFVTQLIGLVFEPLADIASLRAEIMSQKPIFQRDKDFVALPDGDTALAPECKGEQGRQMEDGADVISLKNVVIRRPEGTRLIHIEDFTTKGTGLILIKGENGCGKSTLLNILSRVFSEKQLEIGEGGSCEFSSGYRDSLGYLFYPNFIFSGTVRENVLYGRNIPDREFERVHTLLNLPPADKEVRIKPENLSLGEKQKIYLARLLLGGYKCFFLDEPGSNLDDKTEENLISVLKEMKQNKLLLVISHNNRYDEIADRIYMVKDGRMSAVQDSDDKAEFPVQGHPAGSAVSPIRFPAT